MEIPGTNQEEVDLFLEWRLLDPANCPYVQDVFPELSPTEREFILTGLSAEEQHDLYSEDGYSIPPITLAEPNEK